MAADDHDQQGHRDGAPPRVADLGRGAAGDRAGRARRGRRRPARADRRRARVRVRVGRPDRDGRDRDPQGQPRGDPQGDRRVRRGPRSRSRPRAGRAARRGDEPVLHGRSEDHRDPRRSACGCRSIRRSTPPGTPLPRRSFRGHDRPRRTPTPGWSGSAAATRWRGSRSSSTCSSGPTRSRSRATCGRSRRSRSMPAATGRWRRPCGTWPGRRRASRSRCCSAAPPSGIAAYASWGELRPPEQRAEDALALVRARHPRGQDQDRARPARRGRGGRGGRARRRRRPARRDRRPQPVVADGRRHRARPRSGGRAPRGGAPA